MRRRWHAMLCGLSAGCQLLGYDSVRGRIVGEDASVSIEVEDAGEDASARDGSPLDAHVDAHVDARVELPDDARSDESDGSLACAVGTRGSTLVDDWDDDDALTVDRNGYTYAYSDGSPGGTLTPPSGDRIVPTAVGAANSAGCARITGRGFDNYAGMIVRLDQDRAECPYDASNTRGIGFWLKGTATQDVYFGVATVATRDFERCGDACNDFHSAMITLTSEWRNYTFQWTDLQQQGWGMPASFDPGQLRYIQFAFGGNTTFDLYVDELNLF